MGKNYHQYKAEKQIDQTTCWAASLAWWLKAVGGRGDFTQEDILQRYHEYWKNSPGGTISRQGMWQLVSDPAWRMSTQWILGYQFSTETLETHLNRGPIIIGYFEKKVGGNHVNVIYKSLDDAEKGDSMRLKVMEPDGGKHKTRSFSYYCHGTREVLLGSPNI